MASIHKDIIIDANPDDVWDAVRDFGALHTRLVPGFVLDTRLDGDARIVTFRQRHGRARTAGRLRRCAAAAGLCHHQRTDQAAQRLGAGDRRRRRAQPAGLDRRRAAARNRALHERADGSGGAGDAEDARDGTRHDVGVSRSARRGRPRRRPRRQDGSLRALRRLLGSRRQAIFRRRPRTPPRRRMAFRLGAGRPRDPGRLDRAAARRTAPRRCHRQDQFLRHDVAGLRSRYRRLAHPVDRSGDAEVFCR